MVVDEDIRFAIDFDPGFVNRFQGNRPKWFLIYSFQDTLDRHANAKARTRCRIQAAKGRQPHWLSTRIAVAVIFSPINAVTLSPALCAILLQKPTPARGPLGWFFRAFNYGFDQATGGYGTLVNFLIRKAARSMLLLVVVVGGIWLLSKEVPGGFIPDEDKGVLFVSVQLPEGASLQRSERAVLKLEPRGHE